MASSNEKMAASTEEEMPTLNRFSTIDDLPPARYCFNKDGKVLSYYNFSLIENSPFQDLPAGYLPLDNEYSPATLRRLNYQHENYPYLAFIPVDFSRQGMLERFETIEIEEDKHGFFLKERIVNSWFRFGVAIRGAAMLLWDKLEDPPMTSLSLYTRPERYGYMFTHASKDEAEKRAIDSRDAFLPLIAMLSFVIALHTFRENNYQTVKFWGSILFEAGFEMAWVDALRNSIIARPDAPKTGVIIDFSVTTDVKWWTRNLPFYVHSKVPIFINWGTNFNFVQADSRFDILRPSEETFNATLRRYRNWVQTMRQHQSTSVDLPKSMF